MSLSIKDLTCGYGDLTIVRGLSLDVLPGECVALLGRNGAGKTTTLKAVTGLLRAHSGTIAVGGVDVTRVPPYRRVKHGLALVQEGKRIFRNRTVEENLALGGYSLRLRGHALEEAKERSYDQFPILRQKSADPAGSLSGGQQQMLGIAQALVRSPSVLLLDEPSAGLAPSIVGEVYEVIASLRDAGLTVLLVEQAAGWAGSVADRIAVLDVGEKVYDGKLTGVEAEEALRRIELGGRAGGASADSLA